MAMSSPTLVIPTATATIPTPTASPLPPTPTPTHTSTLTIAQEVAATWTVEAATPSTPTVPPVPRPRSARRTYNAADILAPDSLPRTLAGVHFAGPDVSAADIFGGGPEMTAWAAELAYTSDAKWERLTAQRLMGAHERGFRIILRIDYAPHQHIPPIDNRGALRQYVRSFVRLHERTGRWVKYFVVGNEGNIDEAGDGPSRRTECEAGRERCEPLAHALAYRAVRQALRAETDAYVLVGAASPGTDAHAARWMDGTEYLSAVLNNLHPSEVDGIALHAYAPEAGSDPGLTEQALAHFTSTLNQQIEAVREAGYLSTPLFITEMNQQANPDPAFVRAAYRWIDDHNRRSRQDIVAACWFVYHDETGQWRRMALENMPEVLDAFAKTGAYPPGR